MRKLTGGGTTGSIEKSEDSQNSVLARMEQTQRDRQIWEAVRRCKIGGVVKQKTLQISLESERLTEALMQDSGKAIDNLRIQRLMGINRTDGKATMETIPNDLKDRSMFSCVRYQFFLDAPFEISNECCNVMKKRPSKKYTKETGRHPITAQMASESRLRTQVWLKHGCNAFDAKKPVSNPMSFWTEQDVLLYIKKYGIQICSVYGEIVEDIPDSEVEGQLTFSDLEGFEDMELFDAKLPALRTTGCQRTGCVFCGYGCHHDKSPTRFERLHETHPKLYEYIMRPWDEGGLGYKVIIDWINEHGNLNIRY